MARQTEVANVILNSDAGADLSTCLLEPMVAVALLKQSTEKAQTAFWNSFESTTTAQDTKKSVTPQLLSLFAKKEDEAIEALLQSENSLSLCCLGKETVKVKAKAKAQDAGRCAAKAYIEANVPKAPEPEPTGRLFRGRLIWVSGIEADVPKATEPEPTGDFFPPDSARLQPKQKAWLGTVGSASSSTFMLGALFLL